MGAIRNSAAVNNAANNDKLAESKLYKNSRNYRADRLVEAWSRVPEVGVGLSTMSADKRRNMAISLDREQGMISMMESTQRSQALEGLAPEQVLRMIRMTYGSLARGDVFAEISLETMKDSFKVFRPYWSKTRNGKALNDRDPAYVGGEDDSYDPWKYDDTSADENKDDFRKAVYEDTRDRVNGEFANCFVESDSTTNQYTFHFRALAESEISTATSDDVFYSQKWGTKGANYVDGQTMIYGVNPDEDSAKQEQHVIAIQQPRDGQFYAGPGFTVTLVKAAKMSDKFRTTAKSGDTVIPGSDDVTTALKAGEGDLVLKIEVDADNAPSWYTAGTTKIAASGRFVSELDTEGNYMGEVEIRGIDYSFKPSPTTLGISFSLMSEFQFNTSFDMSVQEDLLVTGSQTLKQQTDYRAFRIGYAVAKTNASHNSKYYYVFDAAYQKSTTGIQDSYIANAQTIMSAIKAVGNVIYNELNRGGVSKIVAGASAAAYLTLYKGFSPKGAQANTGIFRVGDIDGIPVWQAPNNIIPDDEMLCVYNNEAVKFDCPLIFGTFVPFVSTGVIQKSNFTSEAGLATIQDHIIPNRRYLAIIKLNNLKDVAA